MDIPRQRRRLALAAVAVAGAACAALFTERWMSVSATGPGGPGTFAARVVLLLGAVALVALLFLLGTVFGLALARSRAPLAAAGPAGAQAELTGVIAAMTDPTLLVDRSGRVMEANAAAVRLTGWSAAELWGRPFEALLETSERARFTLAVAARDGHETLLEARSGPPLPVALSGSPVGREAQPRGYLLIVRDLSETRRAEQRIRQLARHDALTHLPNRMQFQHLLQQAVDQAQHAQTVLALLHLDLDRFKDVNDTFGHAAGDRAIQILSERLAQLVPEHAVLGRLAGDEFGVILRALPEQGDYRISVALTARRILEHVSRAFYLHNNEVYLSASIGIAFYPVDALDTADLIRNADAAMYHAKQDGGNAYLFYRADMNVAAVERLILKSKLRHALEHEQFVLLYQPKVDLRDGRISGAEALLRWRLPGHGDIPPAQFIPLAEETNLILPIGEWVLKRVCQDYRAWRDHVADPGRVSINLSLKQLRQASFITSCRSVFAETGVSPTSFELEITESTLMNDATATVKLLDELEAMGLHLSIDDFGTGYSSLSVLAQLPVGTLKMDQSFVEGMTLDADDATLARTIVEMGRNLDMDVVAEGIESPEQLAALVRLGCHYGQGRLFGVPIAADEFLALIEQQGRGVYPMARHFAALAPRAVPGV